MEQIVSEKTYMCIDLKSFFASVECVERGVDPFKTNLVVADVSRTEGTVCLAITPKMKELGIRNRCRLFEIPKTVKYIIAKPRMKLYMQKSAEIFSVYLRYVSKEDIHVYSVDECFIDVTEYLKLYDKTAEQFAKIIMQDVLKTTGICATAGIGPNLFLAKVALDITAKHSRDFIGILDEKEFKNSIWFHRPITDVWGFGKGIATRLEKMGINDLCGLAHANETKIYKEFGINAEILIDHANGIEPCTISDIHAYKTKSSSLSNGQVLMKDYAFDKALIVLKEMVDKLVLELVDKRLVANSISLRINYSKEVIKSTGGTKKLSGYTNSQTKLRKCFEDYYLQTTNRVEPIRKINIGLNGLLGEEYLTIDLFSDIEKEEKEHNLLNAVIDIKNKYGKNSILKAASYQEGATAMQRNKMVGGHNSGEDE